MRMKPVAPFLGFKVGNSHLFGSASQVGFGNAPRTDFVIIGMGLFELAQMATLQHEGSALDGQENAHDLKAVAGSFQHDQILGGGVILGLA